MSTIKITGTDSSKGLNLLKAFCQYVKENVYSGEKGCIRIPDAYVITMKEQSLMVDVKDTGLAAIIMLAEDSIVQVENMYITISGRGKSIWRVQTPSGEHYFESLKSANKFAKGNGENACIQRLPLKE